MKLVSLEGLPDIFQSIKSSSGKHRQQVRGNLVSIDLNFGEIIRNIPSPVLWVLLACSQLFISGKTLGEGESWMIV